MDFKVKHIRRFLEEGNKVRLAIVFRGREMAHPQTGKAVLDRVVDRCTDISLVETTPNLEGRRMIMMIAPKPGVVQKALALKKVQSQAQSAAQVARRDAALVPVPLQDDEALDEDAINADVDNDPSD
jgi:translation initiation factor IF-3